jgi:succinate dehydrogenase/fumarate reductase flavoprotein subunit
LVGAATGGGAPNAAWAISSGTWAGRAAAEYAKTQGAERWPLTAAGAVGLRPTERRGGADTLAAEVIASVQAELLPLDKNLFRSQARLERSLAVLDDAWGCARARLVGEGRDGVRAREAAALLACARFAYRSALVRSESRGLHQRLDRPEQDPQQAHSLACTGADRIDVHPYRYAEEAIS